MTIAPISSLLITAATNASPIVLQILSHGLTGPGMITNKDCAGNTGANGTFPFTVVDANHLSLTGSTGTGTYTGGGFSWVKGAKVVAATITKFDSNLATLVTDKTGDTIFGQYALGGSPGVNASSATSSIDANAPGAVIETVGSGTWVLGDGDDVELGPPRTRTILVSCTEAFNEYVGFGSTADHESEIRLSDDIGMGVCAYVATLPTAPQVFTLPLTRLHDKATLLAATLMFFPKAGVLPTVFPTLQIFRFDPSTDVIGTCLAAGGPVAFTAPSSVAAYNTTPPVGATGDFTLATLSGGSATLVATSDQLTDAAGNLFQVTTSGTYSAGEPVPTQAIAPATGLFLGATTNHAAGDVLTWVVAPENCEPTQIVATGGLEGGLNAGYAQTLVFTPDASMAVIDQSTYVYIAVWTDDNALPYAGGTPAVTTYTGIRLDFGNIVAMTPQ